MFDAHKNDIFGPELGVLQLKSVKAKDAKGKPVSKEYVNKPSD